MEFAEIDETAGNEPESEAKKRQKKPELDQELSDQQRVIRKSKITTKAARLSPGFGLEFQANGNCIRQRASFAAAIVLEATGLPVRLIRLFELEVWARESVRLSADQIRSGRISEQISACKLQKKAFNLRLLIKDLPDVFAQNKAQNCWTLMEAAWFGEGVY